MVVCLYSLGRLTQLHPEYTGPRIGTYYILLDTEFLNFDIDTVMKIQYLETIW